MRLTPREMKRGATSSSREGVFAALTHFAHGLSDSL